ncbi:hypothetical protein HK101_004824, partial [Irineochytrium annulatum]
MRAKPLSGRSSTGLGIGALLSIGGDGAGKRDSGRPEALWNASRPLPPTPTRLVISTAPAAAVTVKDDDEDPFMPPTPRGMTWDELPDPEAAIADEQTDEVEEGWGYTQKRRPRRELEGEDGNSGELKRKT